MSSSSSDPPPPLLVPPQDARPPDLSGVPVIPSMAVPFLPLPNNDLTLLTPDDLTQASAVDIIPSMAVPFLPLPNNDLTLLTPDDLTQASAATDSSVADESPETSAETFGTVVTDHPILTDIHAAYTFGPSVGHGAHSVVYAGLAKATGSAVAIKAISRQRLDKFYFDALGHEINFLYQLRNHPQILTLHAVYADADQYFLVTEYLAGGELFDRIVEQEYYSENEARTLVRLVLEAVKHCHDRDIVHRDLKPENILLGSATDITSVKVGDFGYATAAAECTLTTPCGTPSYVAPEILLHVPYGKPVDVWSVGVITFILLVGYMPFHGTTQVELFSRIKTADYDCPDDLSADAQDFLSKMLAVAPTERYTVDQLLCHVWITGSVVPTFPLTTTRDELRRFNLRRKFRAGVRAVQATDTFSKLHKVDDDDDQLGDTAFLVPPSTPTKAEPIPKPTGPYLPSARSWFRSMRIHPNS